MQEEKVHPHEPAEGGKSLEALLNEAQAKIEQQRDSLLRAVADAENARKRAIAESANARKYAVEGFAESLLAVADSLEAALGAAADAPQALRDGVDITLRQLKAAFQKAGITEVAPAPGAKFDPHRHQAMATVEAPGEPNSIAGVMQKGYLLHDRVLRPALVTVTRSAVEKTPENPISGTDLD